MRGIIQRQFATFKRERRNLARELESAFNASFASYQDNPTQTSKIRLEKPRLEYDFFLTESAEKSLNRSKHTFYMKSNKTGTLLAKALKSFNKPIKPIRIKLSNNTYACNPVKIVHRFRFHLASLYTASNNFCSKAADTFFSQIHLPELSNDQKKQLDEPILVDDVAKTN